MSRRVAASMSVSVWKRLCCDVATIAIARGADAAAASADDDGIGAADDGIDGRFGGRAPTGADCGVLWAETHRNLRGICRG